LAGLPLEIQLTTASCSFLYGFGTQLQSLASNRTCTQLQSLGGASNREYWNLSWKPQRIIEADARERNMEAGAGHMHPPPYFFGGVELLPSPTLFVFIPPTVPNYCPQRIIDILVA
jgi:hypothetical protein